MPAPRRVVVTGMGVVAPNAHGARAYEGALREGRSGLRFIAGLAELSFGCQVAGVPQGVEDLALAYFTDEERSAMNGILQYAGIAAIDAWRDAGLGEPRAPETDWETGAILGTGAAGIDTVATRVAPLVDSGQIRRLGGAIVEQHMMSGISARVGGLLGLGGRVSTNASACTTGTEAIIMAARHIRHGPERRMLAGGAEAATPYLWAGFDAMRVLARKMNDRPEAASRPLSATACGFVPGSGAGVLVLEDLDLALARGARIYAEVLGGFLNCGGQRNGGTMTAPNREGILRCIRGALQDAGIRGEDVDHVNGHLTATFADPGEVWAWSEALGRPPERFPVLNATKSLIGHGLGAAGALECAAVVLEIHGGFIHGSANCEDLHPEIAPFDASIPRVCLTGVEARVAAKASFGFGDVNGCVIFGRYE